MLVPVSWNGLMIMSGQSGVKVNLGPGFELIEPLGLSKPLTLA